VIESALLREKKAALARHRERYGSEAGFPEVWDELENEIARNVDFTTAESKPTPKPISEMNRAEKTALCSQIGIEEYSRKVYHECGILS
jgi:hypothetical protein